MLMQRLSKISSKLEEIVGVEFTQSGLTFHCTFHNHAGESLMLVIVSYGESYDIWKGSHYELIKWEIYPLRSEGTLLKFADPKITIPFLKRSMPFGALQEQPSIAESEEDRTRHLVFSGAWRPRIRPDSKIPADEAVPKVHRVHLDDAFEGLCLYMNEVHRLLPAYRVYTETLAWPEGTALLMASIHGTVWM